MSESGQEQEQEQDRGRGDTQNASSTIESIVGNLHRGSTSAQKPILQKPAEPSIWEEVESESVTSDPSIGANEGRQGARLLQESSNAKIPEVQRPPNTDLTEMHSGRRQMYETDLNERPYAHEDVARRRPLAGAESKTQDTAEGQDNNDIIADLQLQLDVARRQGEEIGKTQTMEYLRELLLSNVGALERNEPLRASGIKNRSDRIDGEDTFPRHPGLAGRARSSTASNITRPVGGGRGGGPGAGPNLRRPSNTATSRGEDEAPDHGPGTLPKPSFNGPNRFPGGQELMPEGQPFNPVTSRSSRERASNHQQLGLAPRDMASARSGSLFGTNAADLTFIDHAEAQGCTTMFFRLRLRFKEFFAEFIASTVLVLVGASVDAQVQLSQKLSPREQAGSYSSQNWSWGLAVMCTVHLAGGISGAHCNPGITVALAIFRGFPWRMVWIYLLAQYLGCFCGAGLAYAVYRPAINLYEGHGIRTIIGDHPTGGFFTTVPSATSTPASAFATELCASSVLGAMVLAIGDDSNSPPGDGMSALILGLTVTMIGMSLGWNSGYPINPARDLGPRVFLSVAGYEDAVWTHNKYWWSYGGQGATFLGTIIGCLLYDLLLYHGRHSPLNSILHWRWQRFCHRASSAGPIPIPFVGKLGRKRKDNKQDPGHKQGISSPAELEGQAKRGIYPRTEASLTVDETKRGWARAEQDSLKR